MGNILGEIGKAVAGAVKSRRASNAAKKLHHSSANVAERARKAGDLTKAASEVKAAKKYAGKKGFKRGVAAGVGSVAAGQFVKKNKISVSVAPRGAKEKAEKAVEREKAKVKSATTRKLSTKKYKFSQGGTKKK